jgi:hypothetical protein
MSIMANYMERWTTSALLCSALVLATADRAASQGFMGMNQAVRGNGKIMEMAPGLIRIREENGDQFLVQYNEYTAIVLHATTTIGALQQGMLVRLSNAFDSEGKAQVAEDEISVISPNEQTRTGIFPDGATEAGEEKGRERPRAEAEKPAEKSAEKAADRRAEKSAGKSAEKTAERPTGKNLEKPEGKLPETEPAGAGGPTFTVVGRVATVKEQVLTVVAGKATFKIPLAPDARVQLEQADYRLAQVGDDVKIDGFRAPGGQGQILARSIEITSSKPITAPSQDQRRSKSNRKPRTK